MNGVVYIRSEDRGFAQMLGAALKEWKISVKRQEGEESDPAVFTESEVDVILLDIRKHLDEAMGLLRWIRKHAPGIEVITLNTLDRVTASMEAMQAGASDELTVPLDTEALKKKYLRPAAAGENRPEAGPQNPCSNNSARPWPPRPLPRQGNSSQPWTC